MSKQRMKLLRSIIKMNKAERKFLLKEQRGFQVELIRLKEQDAE